MLAFVQISYFWGQCYPCPAGPCKAQSVPQEQCIVTLSLGPHMGPFQCNSQDPSLYAWQGLHRGTLVSLEWVLALRHVRTCSLPHLLPFSLPSWPVTTPVFIWSISTNAKYKSWLTWSLLSCVIISAAAGTAHSDSCQVPPLCSWSILQHGVSGTTTSSTQCVNWQRTELPGSIHTKWEGKSSRLWKSDLENFCDN